MRRSHVIHTLAGHLDESFLFAPSETLALVDLESYPMFLGRQADYFDMMAHLSEQMQALTVISWRAPDRMLALRVLLAGTDEPAEGMQSGRVTIASGNLRTSGRLCLTTHDRLFDSARNRRQSLLNDQRLLKAAPSQLVQVPPGIYSITVYYQPGFSRENGTSCGVSAKEEYTVLLRHYPFPPPRVAPVRLSSEIFSRAHGNDEGPGAGVITSHARIW